MKRIIGGVAAAAVAVFGGVSAFGDDTVRNEDGIITEGGGLGAFSVRLGDCFNVPEESFIVSLEAVPCGEPHDAEVYALFDQPGTTYPGEAAVSRASEEGCFTRFEPFVGMSYEYSALDYYLLEPTEESWNEFDDREVVCTLVSVDGSKLSGTMEDSRI